MHKNCSGALAIGGVAKGKGHRMRAALVGASTFEADHFRKQHFDYVVAVDGGYAHLQALGVEPDEVVGDFDSLGYVPSAEKVIRYPSEKDASDMALACDIAAAAGCDELVLYGALGGRLDHTLANLALMQGQARAGRRICAVGEGCVVAMLAATEGRAAELRFQAIPLEKLTAEPYRNFLSVFAWGGVAHGVWERGLKYSLEGAVLKDDISLGLSNEFTETEASIGLEQGILLIVVPLAAWDFSETNRA